MWTLIGPFALLARYDRAANERLYPATLRGGR